ncbi:MAG: 30S ribosomal protein S5 [Candidatus Aenigmarchaeota archaeon]|nr:30S ribosomal protein S5 [Candidatus Aenigmarchaeota archaeon]
MVDTMAGEIGRIDGRKNSDSRRTSDGRRSSDSRRNDGRRNTRRGRNDGRRSPRREEEVVWVPRTQLGRDVVEGKYKTIDDVFAEGKVILEPEIVDYLVPDLQQEIIYIGGTPGKGGGIRRTATKMTARMHKSGRRMTLNALIVVGNGDGIVGIGSASSQEHRIAIEKATKQAKLKVIRVKMGCGSWECNCGGSHSIPYKTEAKRGSVIVKFLPTPKGVGIVSDKESKKIFQIAGIKDIWVNASGQTGTRTNLAIAIFDALKNLSSRKGDKSPTESIAITKNAEETVEETKREEK